jgi:predicted dehydrogenase
MNLTPEQKQIGKENFDNAVGAVRGEFLVENQAAITRRSMLIGTAAAVPSLGAVYFGYSKLQGNPVRTGFIGTGDEGSVLITEHPPDYMDIVAVADVRPTNLQRAFTGDGNDVRVGLTKKLGKKKASEIKRYADHKELLADPDIEAVVIAVPLKTHADVAIEAMRAGKHVLCEKLMAHNVAECKEMIRVAREENVLLAIGHQRHYSVLYDNANDLVRNGLLGDIRHIRASWHRNNSFPGRDSWRKRIDPKDREALEKSVQEYGYDSVEKLVNWRLYHETGGGLMAELGSHQLDACSIFLGKVHPIAVQGYGGRNFYGVKGVGTIDKQHDNREIDDHVYVTFEFPGPNYAEDENDVVIVTYSSLNTNAFEPYGERVFGSRATLMVLQEQESLLFKEGGAGGPGGPEQRLWVLEGSDGRPVLDTSETLAPATQAAVARETATMVSRGYTEEMEHFCYAIRNHGPDYWPNGQPRPISDGGLRCNGIVAMADAVMALTANLAMATRKRIEFKPEWFDPDSDAVPESDSDVLG